MMLNQGKSDGEPVLKPETVAADVAERDGRLEGRAAQDGGAAARPTTPSSSPAWRSSGASRFMINNEEAPTGRSAGSLAWAGLANTYYWIDQKKGVGGVYVTQILPFADVKSLPLFYAFEKAVYGR